MRAPAELRADLLDGRLAASPEAEDASTASRIARAGQLAERGDHEAAAREAAELLEAGIPDIRLIGFYLFGLFVQRGVAYLPELLARVGAVVGRDLEALRPVKRRAQRVNSATAWLFEHVSARLQFHTKQRDATWELWREASDAALIEAIAAGCTRTALALEAVTDAPLAAVPLARVRRWAMEDLRRALPRRETAAAAAAAGAAVATAAATAIPAARASAAPTPPSPPPPASPLAARHAAAPVDAPLEEHADDLAGPPLEDLDEVPPLWTDAADDPADAAGDAADAALTWTDAADAADAAPQDDEDADLAPQDDEDADLAPQDDEDADLAPREPARPRARRQGTSKRSAPQDAPALTGSPALAALRAKLRGFQALVARGELAKAAIVAADVRAALASFDPLEYFPALFAGYFRALHEVVDELTPYLDGAGGPAWDALASYYRADMRGFFGD